MDAIDIKVSDISGTVTWYVDSHGSGKSYSTSQNNADLSAVDFTDTFSSVSLPPQTKVVMYSGTNYTGEKLTIGNGSTKTLLIDFSETIGSFPGNIHTGMDWDGINMNDQCKSFQLYENIAETCRCSFFEFTLQYNNMGDEPVILYHYYSGYSYLTYFYADDPNFGPEHNDSTSSLLVFGDQYAYLYEDNNYAGGVSSFEGTGVVNLARIYNLDGDVSWLKDTASSIKVGSK